MSAADASAGADGNVRGAYEARRAELDLAVRALDARSGRLSTLRLLAVLVAIGLGGYGGLRSLPPAGWAAFAVVAAAFLGLVVRHALLHAKKTELEQRLAWIDRGLGRLDGEHGPAPCPPPAAPAPDHPYAGDLDIVDEPGAAPPKKGAARSVFQLVSTAETWIGAGRLASWLLAPAPADVVARRQEAARELAGRGAFREDLALLAARAGASKASGVAPQDGDPMLAWAEAPPALDARARAVAAAARVLVPITVTLFVSNQVLGPERLGLARHAWLVTLTAQALVLLALRSFTERSLATAASREAPFGRYRGALARIEAEPLEAQLLADLRRRIGGPSGADASRAMRSLQTILGWADLRHNPIVHVVVNLFVLWDVWCALALERWRDRHGKSARGWLEALGEIEALASLGALAREHPAWAWPEVSASGPRFSAESLGHPLLPAARRVDNDLALTERGTALLVTGSNMSGKSTLLRSVGVNVALALAGAPVCARRLAVAPTQVMTSMRVKDSLEQGVSHFYAELERLKGVVDAVDKSPDVLFLLDEILHGTNSRERILGAKAILLHLVDRGAVGLVSSHDLGLAPLEEESNARVRNVHFEELVADGKMTFDYKLKPGVVRTANALRLMRLVGIGVDLPDA